MNKTLSAASSELSCSAGALCQPLGPHLHLQPQPTTWDRTCSTAPHSASSDARASTSSSSEAVPRCSCRPMTARPVTGGCTSPLPPQPPSSSGWSGEAGRPAPSAMGFAPPAAPLPPAAALLPPPRRSASWWAAVCKLSSSAACRSSAASCQRTCREVEMARLFMLVTCCAKVEARSSGAC